MPGNIRLWGTSGYVELAAPSTAANQVLTLPTDSVQPAQVLVAQQSFSSAASISFNNCFTSAYENYEIFVTVTGSTTADLSIRLRSAGVDSVTSYDRQVLQSDGSTGSNARVLNGTSGIIGYVLTTESAGRCMIYRPAQPVPTIMLSDYARSTNAVMIEKNMSRHTISAAYDGMTLLPLSGTITGSARLYGYRNS